MIKSQGFFCFTSHVSNDVSLLQSHPSAQPGQVQTHHHFGFLFQNNSGITEGPSF